jgi:hypothetical protein
MTAIVDSSCGTHEHRWYTFTAAKLSLWANGRDAAIKLDKNHYQLTKRIFVLQLQVRLVSDQAAPIMVAFGASLVVVAPPRPRQYRVYR